MMARHWQPVLGMRSRLKTPFGRRAVAIAVAGVTLNASHSRPAAFPQSADYLADADSVNSEEGGGEVGSVRESDSEKDRLAAGEEQAKNKGGCQSHYALC